MRWLSLAPSLFSKVLIFFVPRKIMHAVKSLLGIVWQEARNMHVAHAYGRGLQGRAANPNTVKRGSCPGSRQLGQSILLFIKDYKPIIKADWGPAQQLPRYQQILKLSLSQTSRSLFQQDLSITLEGLIPCEKWICLLSPLTNMLFFAPH